MAKTIFEEMGGKYERRGDYLIPCLTVPTEEELPIGTWGQRHLDYLKQYRKATYINLFTSGRLNIYLADICWIVGIGDLEKYIASLPVLATNVFIPYALMPYYGAMPGFAKLTQKKNAAISKKITTLSKPYIILTDTFHLPSALTSAISFAVALTIRMPVSLIPSRSASSCRRCVFFSGGVSKRNWSIS